MRYSVSAGSDTGKVRRNNEDNFSVNEFCLEMKHGSCGVHSRLLESGSRYLLGVYDGMGGYSDGERASHIAACTMIGGWREKLNRAGSIPRLLTQLCLEANDIVCEQADGSQMGTTCALLCLDGRDFVLCNIGDSPVFLFRDGIMRQISVDHNQRKMYELATGKIAPRNQKFKLTQCIGIPKDEMIIEPYTDCGRVLPGDIFVLCSDGITDMLAPEDMERILTRGQSTEQMVKELIDAALEAGGRDNATVVCVKAEASAPAVMPSGKKSFFDGLREIFVK